MNYGNTIKKRMTYDFLNIDGTVKVYGEQCSSDIFFVQNHIFQTCWNNDITKCAIADKEITRGTAVI